MECGENGVSGMNVPSLVEAESTLELVHAIALLQQMEVMTVPWMVQARRKPKTATKILAQVSNLIM